MIISQFPKKEVVLIKVVQSQVVEVKRSVYVQTDEIPRKALETISRLITNFLAFSAHFNLWNVLQFLVYQITAILRFLVYQNTALFSAFLRPSSVCHRRDISTFLDNLMV